MIKILYPKTTRELSAFHQSYVDQFDLPVLNQLLNNFFTNNVNLNQFANRSARSILLLPIKDLFELSAEINQVITAAQKDQLKIILNYDSEDATYISKQQPLIAKFFMTTNALDISTCYFCNVDHIYSFDNVDDYQNSEDFYRRAPKSDLMEIIGIGSASAAIIMASRDANVALNSLQIRNELINNLKQLKFKSRKNHFTLDHVLDKATHPICSLSLYNFVPSCYSCNSKFKKQFKLVKTAASEFLSPTSKNYFFSESIRFKIFFPLNTRLTFVDIRKTDDFVLNFEIESRANAYEEYIHALKLRPRYIFHKQEIVKLVRKRKKYSRSQLEEIAKVTKMSVDQVKKDIFGEELFAESYNNSSLIKLKRDIAKNIGII